MHDIVIVGASLAGVRALEGIRRAGHAGRVTIVGAESHFPPIDRPPLSKTFLTSGGSPARVRVEPDLDAALLLDTRAISLDVANRTLRLDSGSELLYDGLVIATGARPRELAALANKSNVHVLRGVDDASKLKSELGQCARVMVVGAGVLGCELAASFSQLGLAVTMVEASSAPMLRVVGPQLSDLFADLHAQHGVDLRLGRTVAFAVGDDRVEGVVLDDGAHVPVDLVVVAIGATPETGWLAGSTLTLDDGVRCDEFCFAVGGSGRVVAAGDVACQRQPKLNQYVRVEHWTNAVAQGQLAGANLVKAISGTPEFEASVALPYFWSDQYDWKLQVIGVLGERVTVVEDTEHPKRSLVASFRNGDQLVGALLINAPQELPRWRSAIVKEAISA